MVVEGIALCNSACITCIWCILLSAFCPRFLNNLKQVDSSVCCTRKPRLKKKFSKIYNNSKSKIISRNSRNSSDLGSLKLKYKDKGNPKSTCAYQRCSEIDNDYITNCFNGNDISRNCITRIRNPIEIKSAAVHKRNGTNLIAVEKSKNKRTSIDDNMLDYNNHCKVGASHFNSNYKSGESNRRYRLYAKLSRRSSDSGEHFLERSNRDREFSKNTEYAVNGETPITSSTRKY